MQALKKKHQKRVGIARLVIQMTLYCTILFLFPFPPLPLVALSQSSFLSFLLNFSSPHIFCFSHTNGKRELRVTCAGSRFFASAWSNFYANETLNKIRQSARAASPTQTLWWERGCRLCPLCLSVHVDIYLSFIHFHSDSVSLTVCKVFFSCLMALDAVEQCPRS